MQLPCSKDWKVGEKHQVMITVEMTGTRKAESYDLPSQDIGEGTMPHNSVMISTFDIKDMQECGDDEDMEPEEASEAMDPSADYEKDYAKALNGGKVVDTGAQAYSKPPQSVIINIGK